MPSDKPSLGCIALTDITGTTATGHSNVQPASSGSLAFFAGILFDCFVSAYLFGPIQKIAPRGLVALASSLARPICDLDFS
jgi:hypothetical protein